MSIRIDIISSDEEILNASKNELISEEYEVVVFDSPDKALNSQKNIKSRVVIADQDLNSITGLDFLKKVEAVNPDSIRILLMNTPDLATATKVVNDGIAKKILPSPWSQNELKHAVQEALNMMEDYFAKRSLQEQVNEEKDELEKWKNR